MISVIIAAPLSCPRCSTNTRTHTHALTAMSTVSSSLNLGMYLSPRLVSASFSGRKRHMTRTPHSAASIVSAVRCSPWDGRPVPKLRSGDPPAGPRWVQNEIPPWGSGINWLPGFFLAAGNFAGRPSSEPNEFRQRRHVGTGSARFGPGSGPGSKRGLCREQDVTLPTHSPEETHAHKHNRIVRGSARSRHGAAARARAQHQHRHRCGARAQTKPLSLS